MCLLHSLLSFSASYKVIILTFCWNIGILGNGLTLFVLCSSPSKRNKTFNVFLISQSALDFLLIATAWDVVWSMQGKYFGISGKFEIYISRPFHGLSWFSCNTG